MAKNYFNRYVWLIETIHRHGHITLHDISRQWERSALNDDGQPLAERTFHNHRQAIADSFGIDILCDRALGYYIANPDELGGSGVREWLLESISLNNVLNEAGSIRERILFEKVPSIQRWLVPLVTAMKDGKAVEITHQGFGKEKESTFIVHPYCLKLFHRRWYLLARSQGYVQPRIYGLDRILDLKQTDIPLEIPAGFSGADFFADYYGMSHPARKPVTVELKVDLSQVEYFRSLDIHPSQEEIVTAADHSVFRYRLVPNYEFIQEILSRGSTVEVLAPASLREEIADEARKMVERYA